MGRLISVLALVVLLALVVAASACGTDDPFTVENLNSYGVFESVEPGEDFHRVLTHRDDPGAQEDGIKYVDGSMTFTGPGDDVMTRTKTRLNATISNRKMFVRASRFDSECGLEIAGALPRYDDRIGEESRSWVDCHRGKAGWREKVQISTRFIRDGILYAVWAEHYNQGFPTSVAVLDDLAGCGKTLLSTQGRKLSDDKRRPIACSERIIRIGLSHAECRRDS